MHPIALLQRFHNRSVNVKQTITVSRRCIAVFTRLLSPFDQFIEFSKAFHLEARERRRGARRRAWSCAAIAVKTHLRQLTEFIRPGQLLHDRHALSNVKPKGKSAVTRRISVSCGTDKWCTSAARVLSSGGGGGRDPTAEWLTLKVTRGQHLCEATTRALSSPFILSLLRL